MVGHTRPVETPIPVVRLSGLELVTDHVTASYEFYAWLLRAGGSRCDRGDARSCLANVGLRSVHAAEPDGPPRGWTPFFTVDDIPAAQHRAVLQGGRAVDVGQAGAVGPSYCIDPAGVWSGLNGPADRQEHCHGTNCDYSAVDASAVAKFYAQTLGVRAHAAVDDPYDFHLLHSGRVETAGVVSFHGLFDRSRMAGWLVYLGVDNVDRAAAMAIETGARVLVPANNSAYNRYAVLEDPFGQLFGLSQPLPPMQLSDLRFVEGRTLVPLSNIIDVQGATTGGSHS